MKCEHCLGEFQPKARNQRYCRIKCRKDAGNKRFYARVKSGDSGKRHSEKWEQAVLSSPEQALGVEYRRYRKTLQRKTPDVEFSLTQEEFGQLIFGDCFYCGTPPGMKMHVSRRLRGTIDRLQHDEGYRNSNCVSACWMCNRMKWQFPVDRFVSHIQKISQHVENPRTRKSLQRIGVRSKVSGQPIYDQSALDKRDVDHGKQLQKSQCSRRK